MPAAWCGVLPARPRRWPAVRWAIKLSGRLVAWALGSAALAVTAAEPLRLEVPSLDRAGDAFVQQPAFWFRAAVPGRAPAMLLLHGCGGPYRDALPQRLSQRMRDYARLLNEQGLHVLITDSLTPRGERELCTQKVGTRKVTQTQRRRDALGALQWLAARPDVDAGKLGLLGWSNGGSNVLAATNAHHEEVANAAVKPTFAIAFYPGCEDELRRGYRPVMPLLLLLGEADDWTPAAPCKALAGQAAAALQAAQQAALQAAQQAAGAAVPPPQLESYAGAYHGFDGTAALRLRRDVPGGVNPGQGVHVGGEPAARAASQARLLAFVQEQVSRR